jgi:hypothetical protein
MQQKLGLVLALMLAFVGSAHAALSTEAAAAVTDIGGAITDMEAAIWVPIALVVVAVVSIKLFKRFSNRI